jgi:NAD(P)H-nitrite reductase large subunit
MRFGSEEIYFEDGSVERFDVVILATGYRPRLDLFLELDADILDDDGRPRLRSCISSLPGLYFCGFTIYSGGVLNTIGKEALRICQHIIDTQKR